VVALGGLVVSMLACYGFVWTIKIRSMRFLRRGNEAVGPTW
jgi:hypothetical protein